MKIKTFKNGALSQADITPSCDGNCGMNYCDDNGCIERKRILVEPTDMTVEEIQMEKFKQFQEIQKEQGLNNTFKCAQEFSKQENAKLLTENEGLREDRNHYKELYEQGCNIISALEENENILSEKSQSLSTQLAEKDMAYSELGNSYAHLLENFNKQKTDLEEKKKTLQSVENSYLDLLKEKEKEIEVLKEQSAYWRKMYNKELENGSKN